MFRKRTKLIAGVGINDANYHVAKTSIVDGKKVKTWCKFYTTWKRMLQRCYDKKFLIKCPTYLDCRVVDEWHRFSTFKSWMETQDWQGKELDKDLLVRGNRVYGPNTCVFVGKDVNNFIIESNSIRGQYPIGVCFFKPHNKFMAQCKDVTTGKNRGLGYYTTPEEAHKVWLAFKLEQAKILAAKQTDLCIAKALIDRYENYHSIAE